MRLTDRSRQIAWQTCQHKRYWEYEYKGKGLSPTRPSIDLQIGQAIHTGAGELLKGADLKGALKLALIDLKGLPHEQEHRELVHGLLAALKHSWLSKILAQYKILSIEAEERRELAKGLTMMARLDWFGVNRQTGKLTAGSLKTVSRWDSKRQQEHLHDVQGLSEGWTAEARVGKPIHSVQMLYIVKGYKESDSEGHWFTNPFSHAWIRQQSSAKLSPVLEKAHSYSWDGHRLGSGWKLVPASSLPGGVEQWVDQIMRGLIQPQAPNPLSRIFIQPPAHDRQPAEQKEWVRQTVLQEREVQQKIEKGLKERDGLRYLVQSRRACDWPSSCPFQALCYGTSDRSAEECRSDPLALGLYKWRVPNHPEK